MKINKSLNIDLNIISPQKHIRIHEGDVDSVDILIGVSVDDESVDLTGVTIKYDATINNYLAEQDAAGSVVDDKISIPVTQNMTAMSGLLLIDVRMIQNDQILFTQTICATVEKAVVNGSTYIDFDKITIVQRMNALEEKMDYIEELVENFDTSKLIVSVNRPPEGAPAEVDVDLLRVGDTWILSGANIVYKLVKAQYNYSPAPGVEPRHFFTWQPLNERYGVGNTEPPTSVTYQAVIYTINEVQWSWLPVPEYFKGDYYQMQTGLDDPTYYICKSGTMASTGVCTYTWCEEGGGSSSGITIINIETVPESAEWGNSIPASYAGNTGKAGEIAFWEESGDFWGLYNLAKDPWTGNINYNWVQQADEIDIDDLKSQKMDLAPLNPTAEEIAAMSDGQLYGDTVNHKGVIKGGQEFYDSVYIDENTYTKTEIDNIIGAISTLSFEVVQSKPVSDIKTNVIYLVPKITAETNNVYEEWIYVNNAWELIGATEVDLNNYYTKTEVNNNFLTGKSRSSAPPRKGPYLSQKLWCDYYDGSLYALSHQNWISDDEYEYEWVLISNVVFYNVAPPTSKKANFPSNVSPYQVGYIWVHGNRNADIFTSLIDVYFCTSSTTRKVGNDIWYDYTWVNLSQNFYTKGEVNTLLAVKENSSNKVTSLSSSSTDTQYPSAKCVYDMIGDVESLLSQV